MENKKLIETLRSMAKNSKAANDLFHDFATRSRARGQLLVETTYYRMKRQGFHYSKQEIADIFTALAESGIGTLKRGQKGSVVALTGIRIQLQSLGKAAIQPTVANVATYAPRHRYSPLLRDETPAIVKPEPKQVVLKALSSVDALVRAILKEDSTPAEVRTEAALRLLDH